MEDQELTYQKSRQRRAGIAARQSVAAALRRASDRRISAFLLESDAYRAARTILLYAAAGGEVNLAEFAAQARQAGKTLCYPHCLPGRQMDALEPLGPDSWEEGAYHILTPVPSRSRRIPPEDLELILVPCAAFDPSCRRVGMGGGYYDRFLTLCPNAATVGVAYDCQRVARVASGPLDVGLDSFVTELRWYHRAE
ncbi:MAG: 5-formyltetrahydrofolate cyclo-ligase [Clostridiales bacterium]|nr:5-formyltetrahydrofolate cyclo-ligase [Clostridiales bacterium]